MLLIDLLYYDNEATFTNERTIINSYFNDFLYLSNRLCYTEFLTNIANLQPLRIHINSTLQTTYPDFISIQYYILSAYFQDFIRCMFNKITIQVYIPWHILFLFLLG